MAGETPITVVGNLTADPEIRFIPSGAAVVNFTVASTPRRYDKQANEWVDGNALFLRCNAWRDMAENVAESLARGDRVIVQGDLVQRSFETRDGDKRSVMELEVRAIGPDLRWKSATINRPQRAGSAGGQWSSGPPADDPWGSAPASAPAGGFSDEPPF